MMPSLEDLAAVREELFPAYDDYVHNVSHPHMAISLETATWVGLLAKEAAGSAVDFGSGFTSYVLRKYCSHVWSVDDSPGWLEKTREFLEGREVTTANVVLMGNYMPGQHDLVVYDYGGGEIRDAWSQFAFEQVAPGGIIVVDDMQFEDHAVHARAAAHRQGMTLCDESRGWTLDAIQRWSAYAVR